MIRLFGGRLQVARSAVALVVFAAIVCAGAWYMGWFHSPTGVLAVVVVAAVVLVGAGLLQRQAVPGSSTRYASLQA
jgi:peptidoglycan/LPS O-acetylase OafA/YrhL